MLLSSIWAVLIVLETRGDIGSHGFRRRVPTTVDGQGLSAQVRMVSVVKVAGMRTHNKVVRDTRSKELKEETEKERN